MLLTHMPSLSTSHKFVSMGLHALHTSITHLVISVRHAAIFVRAFCPCDHGGRKAGHNLVLRLTLHDVCHSKSSVHAVVELGGAP